MADPGMQALRDGPEMLAGAPIPFRFEVTWRSLTRPLGPSGAAASPISTLARRTLRDTEAKEWEMVLPRMKRPATLAPSGPPQIAPQSQRPFPDADPAAPAVAPPSFASASDRGARRWLFPAVAALLLPLAYGTLRWTEQRSSPSAGIADTAEMGGAGWISEWASDSTGSARGRQISLYRPSMMMSDYRLEFLGRIERKSLGWVFRAVDSRNYYAGKLEASPPGLAITRFAVIRGVEGPHIQRMLAIPAGPGTLLKVRLDAGGPRFTVYVQNQLVDEWQDEQLKSGGVGFLNEREERAQVTSVQIAFPRGGHQ
jgi:hypothetical protein